MPRNNDRVFVPVHVQRKRDEAAAAREVAKTMGQRKRAQREAEGKPIGGKRRRSTPVAEPASTQEVNNDAGT